MKKTIVLTKIILLLAIILVSCNPHNSSYSKETNEDFDEEINYESKKRPITLVEQFIPPNFVIQSFLTSIDKETNELIIKLDFIINTHLYELLKKTDYYFFIEYPDKIQNITGSEHSDLVKGPTMDENNRLDYYVTFKQSLPSKSTYNIESILSNNSGYDLNIVNEQKEIVHIFKDVSIAATVNYEDSSSIILDKNDNNNKSSNSN
ncbi:hypothetical protein [Salirhabdus salicampi]|uniref:hypothetical protein n=1 Tax=Salirhabdus salicampi TaxID=476102 RepID=UPI0020C4FC2C|nr:hypothetical protein [Salirhabdus salicampi]MCP8616355.1 hypothetical protein [Salirhabdus salicampi]